MANRGEFRYTTNEVGDLQLQRYGTDRVTNQSQWYDVDEESAVGLPLSGRASDHEARVRTLGQHQADQRLNREWMEEKNRALRDYEKGQAAVIRADQAANEPFISLDSSFPFIKGKLPIAAGYETQSLLRGAADLKDIFLDIKGASEPTPNYKFDDPQTKAIDWVAQKLGIDSATAMDRIKAREVENASEQEAYSQLDEIAGSANLGKILPYYVTGLGMPAASNAAARIYNTAVGTVERGAKKVGGIVGDAIRNRATNTSDDLLTRLAQEAEEYVLDPLQAGATARAARPTIGNEFRQGVIKQLGGAALLGAAEGGLNYNESMIDGLYSSVLGSAMGKTYEPFLARAPSKLGKAEQDILKWAESKGYRATPGLATGQPKYQSFESGLRNDERYSGVMKQLDNANDEVITRIAGETMGIGDQEMKNLTPEVLQAHKQRLKDEYSALEANSVGKVSYGDIKAIEDSLANVPETRINKRSRKILQAHIDYLKSLNIPQRGPQGQFVAATFDGTQYQQFRQILKAEADKAFKKKRVLYGSLRDMIKVLDDGMYRGVQQGRGTVAADAWKDLNERYAMTSLVQNYAMDPTGGINLNRLSEHLMSRDASRTLLSEGGRISNLQQLIKLNHLQKTQQGSGLAGPGVDQTADKQHKSEMRRLMTTPATLDPGPLRYMMLRAYQKGIPARTGLLNLSREGNYTAPNLMRMIEQGTDVHPKTFNMVKDYVTSIPQKGKDNLIDLMRMLSPSITANTEPETEEEKRDKKIKEAGL